MSDFHEQAVRDVAEACGYTESGLRAILERWGTSEGELDDHDVCYAASQRERVLSDKGAMIRWLVLADSYINSDLALHLLAKELRERLAG